MARASHGNVKQAALFLDMKTSLRLFFLHQFAREFEHARFFSGRETAADQTQHVDMVEFKALRGVHGHELHGVAGFLLEIDRAAGLLEIIQVLDKFLEALCFALGLPFAHKLREAVEIFPVFRGDGGVNFQGLGEFIEQFGGGQASGFLPQFGN